MGIITGIVQNNAWKAPLKILFLGALLLGAVGLLSVGCGQYEGPATQPPPGESSTKESAGGDTVNDRAVPTTESHSNPTPVQTRGSVQVRADSAHSRSYPYNEALAAQRRHSCIHCHSSACGFGISGRLS